MNWVALVTIVFLVCVTVMIWRVCEVSIQKQHELSVERWKCATQQMNIDWEREKFLYLQEHKDCPIEFEEEEE